MGWKDECDAYDNDDCDDCEESVKDDDDVFGSSRGIRNVSFMWILCRAFATGSDSQLPVPITQMW